MHTSEVLDETLFEWEQKSEDTQFWIHCIAGSLAGISEHVTMIPFDNIKTHSQILKKQSYSYLEIIKYIYKQGGILKFWKGSSIIASGSIPAHATYFSMYELSKNYFGLNNEQVHPFLFGLTGSLATVCHDFIITPFDVLKQRNQVILNQKPSQILKNLLKNEGLFALYRSLPITWIMNIPWAFFLVGSNECLKRLTRKDKNHTFFSYFACAAVSASIASVFTIPLDNIKTRIQTQNCLIQSQFINRNLNKEMNHLTKVNYQNPQIMKTSLIFNKVLKEFSILNAFTKNNNNGAVKYKNISQTIKIIFKEEGLKGFQKGIFPRIISTAPASAVSWACYESMKKLFYQGFSNKYF